MKRIISFVTILGLSALFVFGTGRALADGATALAVQPLTPKPGDVITVKGDLLGPNSEVEVRIIGAGVDIDLGEVTADAAGDFTAQFRVPADLVPGNYQVQASGAKTATATITVLGAGSIPPDPMSQPAPVLRERPLGQSIGLVALFGVLASSGIFFARTGRRAPAADEPARSRTGHRGTAMTSNADG